MNYFALYKVVDAITKRELTPRLYDNVLELSEEGQFKLKKLTNAFKYYVYVTVSNGNYSHNLENPFMYISNSLEEIEPPNSAPFFEKSLGITQVFTDKANTSKPIVSIKLPEILDSNPLDTYEVVIEPMKDFMHYDLAKNILDIDTRMVTDNDLGVLEI